MLAVLLPLLIIFNPELLALRFLGDTALFEMLVLGLSLQMHTHVAGAIRRCVAALSGTARSWGIPSPGLCYLLSVLASVLAGAVTVFQKAAHRIHS